MCELDYTKFFFVSYSSICHFQTIFKIAVGNNSVGCAVPIEQNEIVELNRVFELVKMLTEVLTGIGRVDVDIMHLG